MTNGVLSTLLISDPSLRAKMREEDGSVRCGDLAHVWQRFNEAGGAHPGDTEDLPFEPETCPA